MFTPAITILFMLLVIGALAAIMSYVIISIRIERYLSRHERHYNGR